MPTEAMSRHQSVIRFVAVTFPRAAARRAAQSNMLSPRPAIRGGVQRSACEAPLHWLQWLRSRIDVAGVSTRFSSPQARPS